MRTGMGAQSQDGDIRSRARGNSAHGSYLYLRIAWIDRALRRYGDGNIVYHFSTSFFLRNLPRTPNVTARIRSAGGSQSPCRVKNVRLDEG